jgi:ABC-2 type transport system permease protein
LGINPFPASIINGVLAFISLLLSVSLGFALDLLFASFAIRLKNGFVMVFERY